MKRPVFQDISACFRVFQDKLKGEGVTTAKICWVAAARRLSCATDRT
jgi:hypothetical protein